MNDFILGAGKYDKPKDLYAYILKNIASFIPYDQCRANLINDNGIIYDELLIGVNKRWPLYYREHYSSLYSYLTFTKNGGCTTPKALDVRNWADSENNEFIQEYIKPQGLKYSLGFDLRDNNGFTKCIFSLDRLNYNRFTEKEIDIIYLLRMHLNNLHKNLFIHLKSEGNYKSKVRTSDSLTKCETEIGELICRGVKPVNISKMLCLSKSTVYRHIANMHSKLNVSSCQELILKIMSENLMNINNK
jgi:DNA-binding CsgD family transcriptional regulator